MRIYFGKRAKLVWVSLAVVGLSNCLATIVSVLLLTGSSGDFLSLSALEALVYVFILNVVSSLISEILLGSSFLISEIDLRVELANIEGGARSTANVDLPRGLGVLPFLALGPASVIGIMIYAYSLFYFDPLVGTVCILSLLLSIPLFLNYFRKRVMLINLTRRSRAKLVDTEGSRNIKRFISNFSRYWWVLFRLDAVAGVASRVLSILGLVFILYVSDQEVAPQILMVFALIFRLGSSLFSSATDFQENLRCMHYVTTCLGRKW